jgi:metal-responsive CopG/Arc/MetJ family transcriptional regulator
MIYKKVYLFLIYKFVCMKSILLKLDDKLFEETDKHVRAEKISRSNYIKLAIEQYNKWQAKKALEEQIVREVQLLKQFDPDRELKEEFESVSIHDLQKYLDE